MTARPGRIKAEVEIPLPRPRTAEMMSSTAFTQVLHKLRNLIREESLAAMGNELDSGGLEGFAVDVDARGMAGVI
jgi:NitT/TauT family transport system ATP-binding protein